MLQLKPTFPHLEEISPARKQRLDPSLNVQQPNRTENTYNFNLIACP